MKIKALAIFAIVCFILTFTVCGSSGGSSSGRQNQNTNQNHMDFPLKTIYEDYFLIGNIMNNNSLFGDKFELIKNHFNIMTSENNMKPDSLAPRERGGQYTFTTADNQIRVMLENGIKVHGHTLVWHNQTHAWMTEGTPQQVRQNLINHINTVMAHFRGRVFSWDVVNEVVVSRVNPGANFNDWKAHLRKEDESGWFRALGADYIELAYRTARAADPNVVLYYNDYNLDNQRKAQVVAAMIKEINDKYRAEGNTRNLIEAVGMQGHYGLGTMVSNVRASIERFAALGIKVDISELDVEVRSVGSGSFGTGQSSRVGEVEQRSQALKYAELFNLFMEQSEHITRVTMWGIDDETSWKSLGNPVLWDAFLRPKQAFFAVANPRRTLGL